MKRLKYIIILLFSYLQFANAQGFAEVGTTWKRTQISWGIPGPYKTVYSCNTKIDSITRLVTLNNRIYTKIDNINFGVWNDSLFYEYNQKPCFLMSYKANVGDTIKVNLMPNFLTFTGFYSGGSMARGGLCYLNITTIGLVLVVKSNTTINKNGNFLRNIKHSYIRSFGNVNCNTYTGIGFGVSTDLYYGWHDFIEKFGMNDKIGGLFKYLSNPPNNLRTEDSFYYNYYTEYANKSLNIYDTLGILECTPLSIEHEKNVNYKIINDKDLIKVTGISKNDSFNICNYMGNTIYIKVTFENETLEIYKSSLAINQIYFLTIYNPITSKKQVYKFINNY